MTPKIAVCITTHNRYDILLRSLNEHYKYLPDGASIFIVDDASNDPITPDKIPAIVTHHQGIYRFGQNVGIARAKNKCLELAADWGAEHIFLFDDDTWPIHPDWWRPYVESKEPHLMYIFNPTAQGSYPLKPRRVVYRDENIVAYDHTRGCMLYVERHVLDVVGGFDVAFGKGTIEHRDFTDRIHRAGLTTYRVMDVPISEYLIYCIDQDGAVASTISREERFELVKRNKLLLKNNGENAELYREFREAKYGS